MSGSPQNMATGKIDQKSPQFGTNDNFIPLGFSSPINVQGRDEGELYPSQQRSFDPYSANRRPNFRNNYRNRFQPHNRKSHDFRGPQHHQQQHYQKNQNRRTFHEPQTPGGKKENNSNDLFHPSMLEDPWRNLVAQHERKNAAKTEETAGRSRSSSEVSDEASKGSPPAPVFSQDD